MRPNIISAITLFMAFAAVSCSDDDIYTDYIGNEPTSSPLQFDVNSFTVAGGSSRAAVPSENPEPESDTEKKIRDFWLFQFNPDGTKLADPVYYSIPDDGGTLDELTTKAYSALVPNTLMTIYVVTNTGNSTWATGTEFDSLDKVKEQKLPSPFPIQAGVDDDNDGKADDFYIPMSGQADNVKAVDGGLIVVPVTRMYAKIKIQVGFSEPTMNFYYADVKGIPWYCKVTSLAKELDKNGEPAAVPFPDNTRMISRAFNSDDVIKDDKDDKWLILYMPENIRGEIDTADKTKKTNIPDNALTIDIRSKYNGADYYYTVYPGENETDNFNIRRNCVYRVKVDIRNVTDQHNPSSNCFIVKPGEKLSFEPYYRVEKGGGYDIATYLTPDDPAKAIDHLKIIWQTKGCIGNNTEGKLVRFELNEKEPIHSKIIIDKVGTEGNALVGAYNSDSVIVWSWHIWVTPNEPDNLANAVVYTTYRWDKQGIHYEEPRIPGYGVMPCNIGALAFTSDDDMPITDDPEYGEQHYSIPAETMFPESQIRTFGMLYQWGRKDPFPPIICSTGIEDRNNAKPTQYGQREEADLEYNNKNTGEHFANDNSTIVSKTSEYIAGDNLFYSKSLLLRQGSAWTGSTFVNEEDPIKYSIAHPTVYISGTTKTATFPLGSSGTDEFVYNGDWCGPDGNDQLWGGETGTNGLLIEFTQTGLFPWEREYAHLYDNYGTKSVFDPCPTGWRVPPGDLWLGFTRTGRNPENYEEDVNYCAKESGFRPGLSMYVQRWRSGPTVYFPLQGTRIYNGRCSNPGICGNYHNATCDDERRVNLLHLHRNMDIVSQWNGSNGPEGNNMLFKLFEYVNPQYYAKSTAGPIRCVRDSR